MAQRNNYVITRNCVIHFNIISNIVKKHSNNNKYSFICIL